MKLLVATTNPGKIKEIDHEFHTAGLDLEILGLKDLPPLPDCIEDHPTFLTNAAKKARHFATLSGLLTLADDSGLCVDALHGAPGVLSARYAGEPCNNANNNAKLLHEMAHIPDPHRTAHFTCAMSLALPPLPPTQHSALRTQHSTDLHSLQDHIHGQILHAPRGTHGFGYDPLFLHPPLNKTTAELDIHEKSAISHRGKALRRMIAWIQLHLPQTADAQGVPLP